MDCRVLGLLLAFSLLLSAGIATAQPPRVPGPRKLAPGVLTVIPSDPEEEETFTEPRPLVELALAGPDWQPNFWPKSSTIKQISKETVFRRSIWNLEFAFKPLRMITVDVPQPTGKFQKKLLWYMVYRVKNNGYHLNPLPEEDEFGHKTFTTQRINHTQYFFPTFVLEAPEFKKAYLDRVVPVAVKAIQQREDPAIPLHDSVTISSSPIPLSTDRIDRSVWGVAIWEDVEPKADFISVYIQGLTNAYKFEDPPGAYRLGDPPGAGRKYAQKTLQLNFWRPGDDVAEHESEIRYGLPIFDDLAQKQRVLDLFQLKERVDYRWLYR